MAAILHVRGEIRLGEWSRYQEAVRHYIEYRKKNGCVVPTVLFGMSGPMNSTVLVYRYGSARDLEEEERRLAEDPEYGRVASEMPFRDGSITYELYREG